MELQRRPELRGLPVVVGGRARGPSGGPPRLRDYAGRGVVTTATYEARAFGVRSGMGLMKAAALAPDAVLLPGDFEAYRAASRAFKAALREVAPVMEDRGIDEVYLDLTDLDGPSAVLGRRLKDAVREATGLSCSVGVSPNKLLAKLASEMDKPDGLTLLGLEDLPRRVWPLPCAALNGIGPRAEARLEALGLRTLGDLAAADPALLVARFGPATGAWLHAAAHGRDDRPLRTVQVPKSMARETTFSRDLDPRADREELSAILLDLCTRLARDLAARGLRARTVGVKVRYADFSTVTRDQTPATPAQGAEDLRAAARAGLRRLDLGRRLRLLGVRAGPLVAASAPEFPGPLFADLAP